MKASRLLLSAILILIFSMGTIVTSLSTTASGGGDKGGRVLRHIVLYKFKDELKPQQVDEVVAAFADLQKKIPEVIGLEHGTNLSAEGKSEGLTHAFLVTFRDEAGRDVYLKHPAHLGYVNLVRERREKVVVFDFWAEP